MNNDTNHSPITLKINIPDKGIYEKRFTFNHEDKVWAAKQQVVHEIGKELKDINNYGFFMPPHQGKAGKFMDEGRPLSEYSIPGNDQILEFMLKRRIYRSISYDESKLTKIHNKANLKKLMELVEQNNAGQVNQFLEKGLDPNFQDPKTGETPLTAAAVKNNANEVIMFLINGGAHFDYKNRDGLTAVHKAAIVGNSHNIKTFLDLGASPNYRCLKGLTPLYHACLSGKNPNVAELLLGDQADIGVVDSQGWREIHQVCRYGHVRHLEQLIHYGAEIDAQNGSGNTPLHICSLYNQEDCARLLLYRGARRDIVNFANQTAEMVAVVATNASLSTFIRNYNEKDVVPYIDKPTYSTRRRTQSKSRPTANSVFLRDSTDNFIYRSESLSTASSTPSVQSESSEPLDLSPRDTVPLVSVTEVYASPSKKAKRRRTLSGSGSESSYATDSGDEDASNLDTPLLSPSADELNLRWRTYSLSSLNKEEKGNIPRVKEVKGAANMGPVSDKKVSRKTYVAVTNFTPTQAGELSLAEGDLVEVITKGEKGYWQGSVAGKTGWFPAECVEDLKKRKNKTKSALHKPASIASSLNKSNTSLDQPYIPPVVTTPQPRQVILHKVKPSGFGFQMRGANVPAVNKLEFQPSAKIPALQYVGDVEPGGEADKRGLKKGDYILEVNGNDVKTASHRHVVSLIRKTGEQLVMKVISIDNGDHFHKAGNNIAKPEASLSSSPPANQLSPPTMPHPAVPANGSQDKRNNVIVNGTSHIDGPADKKPPPIPSRAPTTSLTNKPKSARLSVADVDFEKTSNVQEDRVISVPRERIPSTEQQWHSPLTGYSSLPRRPKSSYGAIIGSTHASPSDEKPPRNFHPVESLDNTGFTTLPPKNESARRVVSQDDSAVPRRRPGSARIAKDRPKSWMPKVLPSEPPPISPPVPREQKPAPLTDDAKSVTRTDSKRDKKRRFSFRKKKEKDYITTTAAATNKSAEEPEPETDVIKSNDVMDNLHIEGEENRPNLLPGLHKRLSTFKPVTVPHRQVVDNDTVSSELSQALEKRKSRGFSSGTDEAISPVVSPGHEVPVFPPPPTHSPPIPPRAKSLEESIKEEMMRRRCNTEPASSIPTKPRRTFEYRKSNGETIPEEEGFREELNTLDSELAKAVARRAAKMTTNPKADTHIYENVKNLNINPQPREPRSSIEEPPPTSIEEKLKKLHLDSEVIILPTKFKPPVAPPSGKGFRVKPLVDIPANEKATSQPSGIVPPPEVSSHGKVSPPKTFPKPKKKSPSTRSDSEIDDLGTTLPNMISPTLTSRPASLPLQPAQATATLPPPLLSPEMVATKYLDDVIDKEIEQSNWDTASWKGLSSGQTSPVTIDGATPAHDYIAPPSPEVGATSGPSSVKPASPAGKKKYVYKITLVTEKQADGLEQKQTVAQVIAKEASPIQLTSPGGTKLPPPPAPPSEFLDESALPEPVFTPPTSPTAQPDFSTPTFSPPPPPVIEVGNSISLEKSKGISPFPSPVVVDVTPPPVIENDTLSSNVVVSPTSDLPPPDAIQEPPPSTSKDIPTSVASEFVQSDQIPRGSLESNLDQATLTSLPAPIIHPPKETQVDPMPPSTIPPPNEFKQSKLEPHTEEECVIPPPIFADSTDSQNVTPKEISTNKNQEPIINSDNSVQPRISKGENSQTESRNDVESSKISEKQITEIKDHNISKLLEAKLQTEIETKNEKLLTESENQNKTPNESQLKSEDFVIGGPSEVESPANASTSQVISDTEVQDAPGSKDQNENVVEALTAYTENKEEQALPKTAGSDISSDSSPFREIAYEDWSCVHVCDWLDSIGMSEHKSLFQENDIRGSNLVGLTKEDLRELGVKKLGHRMTVASEINRLTTNNGAATNL